MSERVFEQKVVIEKVGPEQAEIVFGLVVNLLCELGEEAKDLGNLNTTNLCQIWKDNATRFHIFLAKTKNAKVIGILTLNETFAIYANGYFGVIDEMFISPDFRSSGIGKQLIDAAKSFGRGRGWSRIDVTAPEAEEWPRTRRFYEREGFTFTGPKLKFILK